MEDYGRAVQPDGDDDGAASSSRYCSTQDDAGWFRVINQNWLNADLT